MIEIYTDGACSQNGTWDGGWGTVVVKDGEILHSFGGHEEKTTNNRMEMMAFIGALEYLKENNISAEKSKIYTDSAYIVNALSSWIDNWQRNGWKNSKKQEVKNKDLWLNILEYELPVIEKVKGHSGDKFNDEADRLAVYWRDNKE